VRFNKEERFVDELRRGIGWWWQIEEEFSMEIELPCQHSILWPHYLLIMID
jgi:hypothetical protein